jgi:TonB family protein
MPTLNHPRGIRQGRCISRMFLGLFFCLELSFAGSAFAQSSDLDALAAPITKSLAQAQIHTAAVADFVNEGGRVTLQGVLLADKLRFALLEAAAPDQWFTREVRGASGDPGRRPEALIEGRIEQQPNSLKLIITAVNVATKQKLIDRRSSSVPRTRSLDDLSTEYTRPNGPVYVVGQNGVSTPACVYCPYPQYTDDARKKRREGKVVVTAIVDISGRAQRVWEVRGLRDGLTEQAIKVVKQWRFKPGQDTDGHPVAVMVPIDVAFRLM